MMTEAPSFLPLLFLFEGNQSVSCNSLLERKYVRSFFSFLGLFPLSRCVSNWSFLAVENSRGFMPPSPTVPPPFSSSLI